MVQEMSAGASDHETEAGSADASGPRPDEVLHVALQQDCILPGAGTGTFDLAGPMHLLSLFEQPDMPILRYDDLIDIQEPDQDAAEGEHPPNMANYGSAKGVETFWDMPESILTLPTPPPHTKTPKRKVARTPRTNKKSDSQLKAMPNVETPTPSRKRKTMATSDAVPQSTPTKRRGRGLSGLGTMSSSVALESVSRDLLSPTKLKRPMLAPMPLATNDRSPGKLPSLPPLLLSELTVSPLQLTTPRVSSSGYNMPAQPLAVPPNRGEAPASPSPSRPVILPTTPLSRPPRRHPGLSIAQLARTYNARVLATRTDARNLDGSTVELNAADSSMKDLSTGSAGSETDNLRPDQR